MLTAKNLLYKTLDYNAFWNSSPKTRSTPPAKARKEQLDSLLQAFDINTKNAKYESDMPHKKLAPNTISELRYHSSRSDKSLSRLAYIKKLSNTEYLISGEFIIDRDLDKYNSNLNFLLNNMTTILPKGIQDVDPYSIRLGGIFKNLYSYRSIAYFSFESSFLQLQKSNDCGIEETYEQELKKNVTDKVTASFAEIDDILCTIIDPDKKIFSEDEIQYPSYNLAALDLEWYRTNYLS